MRIAYLSIKKMTAKINEIGPSRVSKHCANPSILNVFAISRNRLSSIQTLLYALRLKGIYYIDEPENGCVHIEIPQ